MTLLTHALAFLLGVAVGLGLPGPWPWAMAAGWALWGLRILRPHWLGPRWWQRTTRAHPLTAAALLAWGAARFLSTTTPWHQPQHIAFYSLAHPGARVRVVGRIVRPPRRATPQTAALVLQVQRVRNLDAAPLHAFPLQGRLYVRIPWHEARGWRYGDRVTLRGRIFPVTDAGLGYRAYLARLGAQARLYAFTGGRLEAARGFSFWRGLYALRDRAHALVQRFWPGPEGALFAGVLLGIEEDIPDGVYEAFRRTGTAHIIVISGFNITIIAGLVVSLTERTLGRLKGALTAAAAIAGYTLLVGADPAVVRAALMGGLSLLARQVGRRQHGLTTLAVSAAAMVAVQPWALWDIGFQLSFAATLGLMLYAEPLTRGFFRLLGPWRTHPWARRLRPWVQEFFLLTLAAQLLTLPLSAYYFHRVSWVALLANPLILPAQAPLMVLGGLAVLLGLVVEPVGRAVAWAAWPWAAFTVRAVEAMAQVPDPTWHVGYWPWGTVVGAYALLAGLTWAAQRGRLRWHPAWVALGLAALNGVLWSGFGVWPDGRLHLWFLPVPGGQAVVVAFPRGARVLVNGGADPAALDAALRRALGPAARGFDAWVVASNEPAELAALSEVLERYPPAWVWWLPRSGATGPYQRLQADLRAAGVAVRGPEVVHGLSDGAARMALLPGSPRGGSLVVAYGAFRALLFWHGEPASAGAAGWAVVMLAQRGATWRSALPEAGLWVLGAAESGPNNAEADLPGLRAGPCVYPLAQGLTHVWSDGRGWGVSTERGRVAASCASALVGSGR